MKANLSAANLSFTATWSPLGLSGLQISHRPPPPSAPSSPFSEKDRRFLQKIQTALTCFFRGRVLPKIPFDWNDATLFQQSVWRELQKIPRGQTRSYGEIARRLGKPRAARAVGAACGANPILLLVPCHRVLASNGKLGGFSCGLPLKKKLLKLERNSDQS